MVRLTKAEEPLPQGGSCSLCSINLSEFVKNPFGENAYFDMPEFSKTVRTAVRAQNDVLDEGLTLHPLEEQRRSVFDWRQIGVGIMGLADMLIKLGVRYGSKKAVELCDLIGQVMAETAIRASNELAKETSAYPMCDSKKLMKSEFFKNHCVVEDDIKRYGLRNSQLLTVAPTGTLSTMIGCSGGSEPIFANYYERTTKSLHGKDVTYKVYTPVVQQYMFRCGLTDASELPDYFVTAQTLDCRERIDMQAALQKHIDASISSTVNLPFEATVEQIEDLYMYAWKSGVKGVTVFRDGCSRKGILTTHTGKSDEQETIKRGEIVKVPSDLTYRKYKLKTGCGTLYLFVGVDKNGKIHDLFTNTDGVGGCTINTQANSRLISACIRGGVPIEYIVQQLNKAGTCPSFQYARGAGRPLSAGKSCASAIGNVLKQIMKENEKEAERHTPKVSEKPKEKENAQEDIVEVCPQCGAKLTHSGGCVVCQTCAWSKCEG